MITAGRAVRRDGTSAGNAAVPSDDAPWEPSGTEFPDGPEATPIGGN